MSITHKLERAAMSKEVDYILRYLDKDREKNLLHLVDVVEKFAGDMFQDKSYEGVRQTIQDSDGKWMDYINQLLDEIHPNVLKTTVMNLGYEAAFHGTKTIRKMREKHQCNIPWVMLIDPTSACNLHCTGCWAAEYGHNMSLSYEQIDNIITQGKELGIYFYMYTGGEPLIRKKDLIRLCRKHNDCAFHAFTNGTLVDDAFCNVMEEVGNLSLSLSLEGFEEVNDSRRGEGVFKKVLEAMDILKRHGQIFGTSICYTRANVETVTSDEFLDMIIAHGCRYSWYFHYMPVGNSAVTDLIPTIEQREFMYHRVREVRGKTGGKPIFLMDFQNDGEFVGGCIAGGRNYLHINANGDVEPCVFIHYSNANIKDVSLLDALKQPIFMAYREHQPFNENHLRPCPMLENPEMLERIVNETHAKPTDFQSKEEVASLCAKCHAYSEEWARKAEELWAENPHHDLYYKNYKNVKK